MRREIYVAYGFRTGHHFVKVNVEKKIKVLCQLLSIEWLYMPAMGFEKIMHGSSYLEHL